MKKVLILLFAISLNNYVFGAGSDSSSETSETALYDQAVKLVKRAGKLEKKDKDDKAKKLYSQAFEKLNKAVLAMSILAYPLLDTLRVFTIRILGGNSPFKADNNHIHHKLIRLGLTHTKAVFILYFCEFNF